MDTMTDLMSRVVADAADPERWQAVRSTGIGASDAASFAKLESVEKYARAKIKETFAGGFAGNAYTATGKRWEAAALSAAGIQQNTLMFRSADVPQFFATPDGVHEGEHGIQLAEAKAVLVRDYTPEWVPKMPPTHRRQIAWAQMVCGAYESLYVVLPYDENHTPLAMLPTIIRVPRDEALIEHLVTIAHPVLRALNAARDYERKLNANH